MYLLTEPLTLLCLPSLPPQDQKAGTTAVMALLREDMIHVAWVGDSQAMLFRKGEGIQLVDPHKPDREVASSTVMCYLQREACVDP